MEKIFNSINSLFVQFLSLILVLAGGDPSKTPVFDIKVKNISK